MAYEGTSGDDVIDAIKLGLTNVHIRGGAGNDTIMPAGYAGCEGEAGNDTIIGTNQPHVSAIYANAPSGIIANLATGIVQDGYGTQDTLVDIFNITGSPFNDQFFGSQASETFDGGGGSDTFVGGGGFDTVNYRGIKSTEVQITYDSLTGITTVKKSVPNGDQGMDSLKGVNSMSFADGVIVATVADTPYYSLKANAFPKFSEYYSWSGWTTGSGVVAVSRGIADINGDGKADIVLDLWEGVANATVTNIPTPNRVVIFESQPDGTYIDATAALLGTSSPLILEGEARNLSVGDVNSDGRPDFALSISWDDGRTGSPPNSAPLSAVLVSQTDGTYKTITVGFPDFSQSIAIATSLGVGHVFINGYGGGNSAFPYWDPTGTGQVASGGDYVLNAAGTAFVLNSRPPINGNGLVPIPSSTANGAVTQIVTIADASSTNLVVLGVLGNDGQWTIASSHQPYQSAQVPFVSSQGIQSTAQAAMVNNQAIFWPSFDDFSVFYPYPGSVPIAVLRGNGLAIVGPQTDGAYHQNDGVLFCMLHFYATTNNIVTPAPIQIIGEDTVRNINFVDFVDVNSDGLQDIITYPYTSGGQPIVYLNTGAGKFVHIDPSAFPQAPNVWGAQATAKFLDANGDGIFDLMYWPSNGVNPSSSSNPNTNDNTPLLYLGTRSTLSIGNTYTESVTISDRITSPLIHTWAGNDTIYDTNASTSPTSIDGGLGTDTVVYSGVQANYTITSIADGFKIDSNTGIHDTLKNVEYVRFADKTIFLDVTAPAVTGFVPASGSTGIAVSANVVLTFSEPIQLGIGSIVIKTVAGTTVVTYDAATSTNLSVTGSTLTINPTADLTYSTGYKVEFAAGTIKDLAGNSYAGTTSYNFTTNGVPVATSATVSAVEDTAKTGTLTGTGPEGSALTFAKVADPSHGTVTINASTGAYVYTPASNYNGADSFTFKVNDGTADSATSTASITVSAVNDAPTGTVTISGIATQGQILIAVSTLADADGLGTISYQWKAAGVNIAGATGGATILAEAQVGKAISVTASYMDRQGTLEAVTSTASAAVANTNDAPTGSVTITGTPTQGQALTLANTLADLDGLGVFSYLWKADGVTITGETLNSLPLVQAQVGKAITVAVSYTDGHGTAEGVASAATSVVANVNDAPTGTVTITGTATQGQTLTVSNSLADADGLGTISYQWQAAGVSISGATANSYSLNQAEVGKVITVTASYTDALGMAESKISTPTSAVAANQTLAGGTASESFTSGPGNDSIDGGAGTDTVIYSGSRASFSLTKSGTGFALTDSTGSLGTDTLQNVERIKFPDGSIALDVGTTQPAGQTVLLLGAVLPGTLVFDASKQALLGAVIDLFDQGFTLQDISGAVMRLPIWDVLTRKTIPTTRDIANYLLTNVNGVAPDTPTLLDAVLALNSQPDYGHGQGTFLWHLAESTTNQTHVGLVGLATTGLAYSV